MSFETQITLWLGVATIAYIGATYILIKHGQYAMGGVYAFYAAANIFLLWISITQGKY
jgi:hypothetical protein